MSTSQKKEPIITFFGEGHLKTLYKDRKKIERDQSKGEGRGSEVIQRGQRSEEEHIHTEEVMQRKRISYMVIRRRF